MPTGIRCRGAKKKKTRTPERVRERSVCEVAAYPIEKIIGIGFAGSDGKDDVDQLLLIIGKDDAVQLEKNEHGMSPRIGCAKALGKKPRSLPTAS